MTSTLTLTEARYLAWATADLLRLQVPPETTALQIADQIGYRRMLATGGLDVLLSALLYVQDGMDRVGVEDIAALLAYLEERGFRSRAEPTARRYRDRVLVLRGGKWVRDRWPGFIYWT